MSIPFLLTAFAVAIVSGCASEQNTRERQEPKATDAYKSGSPADFEDYVTENNLSVKRYSAEDGLALLKSLKIESLLPEHYDHVDIAFATAESAQADAKTESLGLFGDRLRSRLRSISAPPPQGIPRGVSVHSLPGQEKYGTWKINERIVNQNEYARHKIYLPAFVFPTPRNPVRTQVRPYVGYPRPQAYVQNPQYRPRLFVPNYPRPPIYRPYVSDVTIDETFIPEGPVVRQNYGPARPPLPLGVSTGSSVHTLDNGES